MAYSKEIFLLQYSLVDDFVRHLLLHRILAPLTKETELKSAFWGLTVDAHLLQASIYWCMVFGSTGMNQTHWTRLRTVEKEEINDLFRSDLLDELQVSAQDWEAYWCDMTYFRNNYAAHRAGEYDRPVPNFDNALTAAFIYDRWVRAVIRPDRIAEPPLAEVAKSFQGALQPLLVNLVNCGRDYEQRA